MKRLLPLFLIFLLSSNFKLQEHNIEEFDTTISKEELKLYDLIMTYRKSKKLPKIPLSKSLTYVAQEHCKDLAINKPDLQSGCNAHSWSDKGKWSSCCYTSDHKKSKCMWDKPKELTSYTDNGYEIACGSSDPKFKDFVMTADYALGAWKKSVPHNNVIINKGNWTDMNWNAIGIGIHGGFATVWFGTAVDKEGEPAKPAE